LSIPSKFDGDLAAVDMSANSIVTQLRVMQHAAPRDLPRLREALREKLKAFNEDVMATARNDG